MAYKDTVAIIGAATAVGAAISKSIAAKYRLLLMDTEQSQLVLMQKEIQAMGKNSEVDILYCCKNASWEADMVVVANDGEGLHELAVKMKEVTNCKTVLHFLPGQNNFDQLQQLLPHAKVVTIIISSDFTDTRASSDAFIHGSDHEAMETAKMLVSLMGCKPKVPGEA